MSSKIELEPAHASLAARLTAWYVGTTSLLLLAVTGFLYWALISNLDREDDQYMADKVRLLDLLVRERGEDGEALRRIVQQMSSDLGPDSQLYVRVLGREGAILAQGDMMPAELDQGKFPRPVDLNALPAGALEVESPTGRSYRLLAVQAAPSRQYQLAFDRTSEEHLLARYRQALYVILGLALAACAVLGYQIARRGLRPLTRITQTVRQIRSTTLDQRLETANWPAELVELAVTFNDMLNRLEDSFQRLAQFSADIAHELRTPLNNLRGEAEVALGKPRESDEYRHVLGSCLEEAGRLARLIDSLLFLARAESPQTQLVTERVSVEAELAAVREFYEATAAEAGVTLHVGADPKLKLDVDRGLFQRAIGNLVANALAHTPAGGKVLLLAAIVNDAVYVEVADTGSGIAPEHVPHVFDRFYRADRARTTTSGHVGLGLALVKSIATLHRGTATLQSTLGKGTCVRLTLPKAE